MSQPFDHLCNLVSRLRAPDGCPWDRKQTHDSLKPHLLEESYEVLEAIDEQNPRFLLEELGDLLLQVLLHAQIEQEARHFSIDDVITHLSQKLIRRHPHVFAQDTQPQERLSTEQVIHQWEQIKKAERKDQGKPDSILNGIPPSLPSLLRAHQIQSRVSRVGFDWQEAGDVVEKLDEELAELREAVLACQKTADNAKSEDRGAIEEEFGDVLFTMANLARFLHIHPEEALRKSCNRFIHRFHGMEAQASSRKQTLQGLTPQEWDDYWKAAKQDERLTSGKSSVENGLIPERE